MLNNFTHCPVCQKELIMKTPRVGFFQNFVCCEWHLRLYPGVWEEVTFQNHAIVFYKNRTEIRVYDKSIEVILNLENNLSFCDLNSYEKCLELAQNNELLK